MHEKILLAGALAWKLFIGNNLVAFNNKNKRTRTPWIKKT